MKQECHRRVLAQFGTCTMEACGCGALHLTLGPFTVRLEVAAAQELATVLRQGLAVHEANRNESVAVRPPRH